jgi:hypothetical protein
MAKTVLTIEVEYDEKATEPEAIASAADRLLETALSTPGVLDEHGELRFGEFVAGPGDDARGTSPYYKTVRLPVEISFTTDPEELDDRQDEPVPTKGSLLTWLQDALVLQVDTESYGQPAGAVFAAAGVEWDAATLEER